MNRGEIVEKEEIYNLLIKGRPSTLRKVDLEVYIQSLEDKNKELEQQVESMKCCGNCKHYSAYNIKCSGCNKGSNWQPKESN